MNRQPLFGLEDKDASQQLKSVSAPLFPQQSQTSEGCAFKVAGTCTSSSVRNQKQRSEGLVSSLVVLDHSLVVLDHLVNARLATKDHVFIPRDVGFKFW